MRSSLAVGVLGLALLASGCPGPPEPMPVDAGRQVGQPCSVDADCVSGTCLATDRICTGPCTTDADCPMGTGLVCGTAVCAAPEGCRQCVPQCGSANYTCVGGVSTDCSLAPDDSHCLDCGCPVATEHCVRDVGCFPPAAVGEACNLDRDCASNNCSTFGDVCRVAVGRPCTTEDCDICLTLPSAVTHCSRECRTAADCGRDMCVGSMALMSYECRPSACTGTACTRETALHEVGQTCHEDAECRSGTCFSADRCVGTECIGEGWCSGPCTASADCGAGTSCVVIPCAAGQTAGCGSVCLHACEGFVDCGVYGGTCREIETPERTLASVCDVRRETSRACRDDAECVSTRCVSGFCAP